MMKVFRNRALFYRIAAIIIVTVGFVFFVGLGSQNIAQYVVLGIMLAAAYAVGQTDMREKFDIQSVNALAEVFKDADKIIIGVQEGKEENDTVR